jgi:glycerol dehydrogenase-like iron-containing ADH family enzyme
LADAPAAAAHSFAAGISVLPESRAWLHGEWVGLGLRFQELLLEEPGEGLDAWLESRGLLRKLPLPLDDAALRRVLGRMREPQESLWLLQDRNDLTEERLFHALDALRS